MGTEFAIISDLHCHHSSCQPAETLLLSDLSRSPSNRHPVQALAELIAQENLSAEALLVPGDLTNKVDPQGMHSGWGFVREIGEQLRSQSIIATLGNHDVASRASASDPFALARGLSPLFPSPSQSERDMYWSSGFYFSEGADWRVLAVNSVTEHVNPTASQRGSFSEDQISRLKAELLKGKPKRLSVAICHHHPIVHEEVGTGTEDVMTNGSILLSTLSSLGFDLVVHGHKHHPKLSYFAGEQGSLPVLAAGSFSAGLSGNLASRTRNLFHIVSLHPSNSRHERAKGRIRSWEFQVQKGWVPSTFTSSGFPHKAGFGETQCASKFTRDIIDAHRRKGETFLGWESLLKEVPELEFVPPHVLAAIGKEIEISPYQFTPSLPDVPATLGSLTKRAQA